MRMSDPIRIWIACHLIGRKWDNFQQITPFQFAQFGWIFDIEFLSPHWSISPKNAPFQRSPFRFFLYILCVLDVLDRINAKLWFYQNNYSTFPLRNRIPSTKFMHIQYSEEQVRLIKFRWVWINFRWTGTKSLTSLHQTYKPKLFWLLKYRDGNDGKEEFLYQNVLLVDCSASASIHVKLIRLGVAFVCVCMLQNGIFRMAKQVERKYLDSVLEKEGSGSEIKFLWLMWQSHIPK